jgi:hypothetical protein
VFSFTWYAVNEEGGVIRFGIVTYGKHDCGDFLEKKDIFRPCIRENQAVWDSLPKEEKSVGAHVFEGCDPKLGKFFQNPHTMKLVYYGCHHDIMREVITKFPPRWKHDLAAFVAALVFGSKTSECPQHFWHALNDLLRNHYLLDPDKSVEDMDHQEIVWDVFRCCPD